jgi:hypothetical protein
LCNIHQGPSYAEENTFAGEIKGLTRSWETQRRLQLDDMRVTDGA